MSELIRSARKTDAEGIATVHIETWRECYKGIVPQLFLDGFVLAERTKRWEEILSTAVEICFVAEKSKEIIGWVTCGANRDKRVHDILEIYGIYVLPKYWNTGVGRGLFDVAIQKLNEQSLSLITLWVLKENVRAQVFYEKLGFSIDGTSEFVNIGGEDLEEIRFARHFC